MTTATATDTTLATSENNQKFPNNSFVELASANPWKTFDNKVIEGAGFVDDYTPDTGYLIKAGNEYLWCKEGELRYAAGNPAFCLEAFVKGVRAFTRCGCTAKFLKFDKKNITYQVLVEVNCNGKITHQHYTKEGFLNKGIDGDSDLIYMQNLHSQEEMIFNQKKEVMTEVQTKEIASSASKEDLEKEPTEILILQAQEPERAKKNSDWVEWFFKYLKAGIEIEEIESCSVRELQAVVQKFSSKITFKE